MSFLSALAFFVLMWLGIWQEIDVVRHIAMALFAMALAVGIFCFLMMFPILIGHLFKTRTGHGRE